MAELYVAGLGKEWQIALLGSKANGGDPMQML